MNQFIHDMQENQSNQGASAVVMRSSCRGFDTMQEFGKS
jgi:hypothetical protein